MKKRPQGNASRFAIRNEKRTKKSTWVFVFQKYTAYFETFHYVISSDIKDLISELCLFELNLNFTLKNMKYKNISYHIICYYIFKLCLFELEHVRSKLYQGLGTKKIAIHPQTI